LEDEATSDVAPATASAAASAGSMDVKHSTATATTATTTAAAATPPAADGVSTTTKPKKVKKANGAAAAAAAADDDIDALLNAAATTGAPTKAQLKRMRKLSVANARSIDSSAKHKWATHFTQLPRKAGAWSERTQTRFEFVPLSSASLACGAARPRSASLRLPVTQGSALASEPCEESELSLHSSEEDAESEAEFDNDDCSDASVCISSSSECSSS